MKQSSFFTKWLFSYISVIHNENISCHIIHTVLTLSSCDEKKEIRQTQTVLQYKQYWINITIATHELSS